MDDTFELLDTEGSVAQVQSQHKTSASKQNINSSKGLDDPKIPKEDKNCNLTIIPSAPKLSPEQNEDKLAKISQVSAHLKEKLSLKCGTSVNGIVNGLGVGVDLSHTTESEHFSISNDKTSNSGTSSHCDTCDKISIDGETNATDYKCVSNCMQSHPDKLTTSSENVKCNDDVSRIDTTDTKDDVKYVSYKSELQMPDIMRLIQKDLSEPYSIYTYRYFIHNWPKLCFLVGIKNCILSIKTQNPV